MAKQGRKASSTRKRGRTDSSVKANSSISAAPVFETRKVLVIGRVLVFGGGFTGLLAGREIQSLGIETVLIERREAGDQGAGTPAKGMRILFNRTLKDFSGHIGSFEARFEGPEGTETIKAGAVVVAEDRMPASVGAEDRLRPWTAEIRRVHGCTSAGMSDVRDLAKPGAQAWMPISARADIPDLATPGMPAWAVPLHQLIRRVQALAPRREGLSIGMVLDLEVEEGPAGTELALETALSLLEEPAVRREPEGRRLFLFCRETRVAGAGLESLYSRARSLGMVTVKYDGALSLEPRPRGAMVRFQDPVLGTAGEIFCDCLGVSRLGLAAIPDPEIAARLGLRLDGSGQIQENNPHLFPTATNRPGIFTIGSCRAPDDCARLVDQAEALALEVHRLLSPGFLTVELSQPQVDSDRCALCLTCVRACPFGAMRVDAVKKAAECVAEACQRCGLCAGECPARAIELPLWTEERILGPLGIAPAPARPPGKRRSS